MNEWIQVAPGVWRCDQPIDPVAATQFMNQRLASRGYKLHERRPSLLSRLRHLLKWSNR